MTNRIIPLEDGRALIVQLDNERDEVVIRVAGVPDFRADSDVSPARLERALNECARRAGTRIIPAA